MIGVSGHDSALLCYTRSRTTWANEMHFVMNHAADAGSITLPVDQQSSMLPLSYGCPFSHDISQNQGTISQKLLGGKMAPKLVYCTGKGAPKP